MDNETQNQITLTNSSFNADLLIGALAPDSVIFDKNEELEVPSSFALCRDQHNNVTAMYGANQWDFNPYRLSANRVTVFNFDTVSEDHHSVQKNIIINEMKTILFHLMYSVPAGHTGVLAVSTLYNYFIVLMKAARYCFTLSKKHFFGEVTLRDLFSDKRLFTVFVLEHQKPAFNSKAKALVKHLLYLGESLLKFNVAALSDVDIDRLDNDQTVVIPQRIYMLIGDHLESEIKHIFEQSHMLASFITKLKDPHYGISHERQKALAVGGKAFWRPDMQQALEEHGLTSLFKGDLAVSNRNNLQLALLKMQYLCKLTIHYYTGMRNQEVQRLLPKCINHSITSDGLKDGNGKVIDKAKIVEVISSTTKFTGRRVQVSWFAPDEVKKAVAILERIHHGLSALHDLELKDDWLLITTEFIKINKDLSESNPSEFKEHHKPSWLNELKITELDFQELIKSDDSRDWLLEKKYQIGEVWPLHSHQFRRSLAYYASNTGYVSLASLKAQFKHLTQAMSRYYAKNFEKAESIFGFYNEKTGQYELPPEHIIKEFRTGIPFSVADQVLADILGDEPLYGKTGSYMERQSEKLRKGEVVIDEVRSETAKRVERGEIAYRNTLLGGCTKVGDCDSFMLGDFISCLTCDGAVIKESNVVREIEIAKEELELYEERSGEYQLTKANLDELVKYKKHRIDKKQSELAKV